MVFQGNVVKKYEVSISEGERKTISADRVTVEAGALVFYARRSPEDREEIVAAWGPYEWRLVLALTDAGKRVAKID